MKLVSLLFTPVYYLPEKSISHQLSQRERFYLLVSLIFLTPKSLLHRRFPPFHSTDLIPSRRIVKFSRYLCLIRIGKTVYRLLGVFVSKRVLQQILKLLVQFSLLKSVPVPSYEFSRRRSRSRRPAHYFWKGNEDGSIFRSRQPRGSTT